MLYSFTAFNQLKIIIIKNTAPGKEPAHVVYSKEPFKKKTVSFTTNPSLLDIHEHM